MLLHRRYGLPAKRYHFDELAALDTRLIYTDMAVPQVELRLLLQSGKSILLHSTHANPPVTTPYGLVSENRAWQQFQQLRQQIQAITLFKGSDID
jgi:hypothetical protein